MSAAGDMPWRPAPGGGLLLDVRLTPRGGRDAIDGIERRADGRTVLKARVRAPAFEGEANAALCRLVAAIIGTAPRQITLVAGATARVKCLRVAGDPQHLVTALTRGLDAAGKQAS